LDLIKERLYYTIGEVSDILDLKASTIRYWEKHFPILKPTKRTGSSKRKFDLKDIQTLFKIKTVLKDDNNSIKKANLLLKEWVPAENFEDFKELVEKAGRPKIVITNEKYDRIKNILNEISGMIRTVR
jgi:DNA-binding transcriptional MerR regulator